MEEWLRAIGLGERTAAFQAQEITLDLVPYLTERDLAELGLTIGERKRFRIAATALAATPPEATKGAERRPLSVMFVDLADSSALAERLEAEDLLEVIRRYRAFAGAAIKRFGGHVARLVGDGILAYFCYPQATENDPERAVRAALEISLGIGAVAVPAPAPLAVRIGIATGRVIVSNLFAGGKPDLHSIIGATPNLAARLQGFAPAGGIIIAEETYARLPGLIACEDLGEHAIRGFTERKRIWRVISVAAPGVRAAHGANGRRLTSHVGRETELAALAGHWRHVASGGNATVLVTGEAGIGKSRLVEQFLSTKMSAGTRVVRLAASALDVDSALYPVVSWLRATAGLAPDEPASQQMARLESMLAGDAICRQRALPVMGAVAGISFDDPLLQTLSPGGLREQMLSVLTEQLLLPAEQQPLALVVEDLHWLDPTSLELLERLVAASDGRRVLLLLTTRHGFQAPWLTGNDVSVLNLARLPEAAVAAMLRSLLSDRALPKNLCHAIAERTDGVPLFVEEVVRALLAADDLEALSDLDPTTPERAIPASLQESLMARLDRTGIAKRIAQIAAVIGRSVRCDVLSDVAGVSESALEAPLARLTEAGVLFRNEAGGQYAFSHALLRDAAYASLLRDDRQSLHLSAARALAERDPQLFVQQPELLAMHLTEGNEAGEAAPHWLEAGRRALARSALTEATRLLRRGLEALEKGPPELSAIDHRLAISALLGPALIALKGPASLEAQALYGSAYVLSERLPDHPSRFPLTWGWWRVARAFDAKQHRAEAMLARAMARNDAGLLLQAHHCNWATHYDLGDFERCVRHVERGLEIYRAGEFRHHARLYGNHDALVCGLGALAQVAWMQGRPLAGLAHESEGRSWATAMRHVGTAVHSLDVTILHHTHRRELRLVGELARELLRLTSEHAMVDHHAKGLIFYGWAMAMAEDAATGLRTLEEGMAQQRAIGTLEDFPVYVCLHAEALARTGKCERAVEELARDRSAFDAAGVRFWAPEVLRTEAEMTLRADADATAVAAELLGEAAAAAERQGVPMLGLRIALSAARLEASLGERKAAVDRIRAALSGIREDDGGADLKAARALMKSLQSQRDSLSLGSVR